MVELLTFATNFKISKCSLLLLVSTPSKTQSNPISFLFCVAARWCLDNINSSFFDNGNSLSLSSCRLIGTKVHHYQQHQHHQHLHFRKAMTLMINWLSREALHKINDENRSNEPTTFAQAKLLVHLSERRLFSGWNWLLL